MTADLDAIESIAQARIKALKAQIKAIKAAATSQPGLLAQARKRARAARAECLADPENTWQAEISAISTLEPTAGETTGRTGTPDYWIHELWGKRMASDLLAVAGDYGEFKDVLPRYASLIEDPAHLWKVAQSAMHTIAMLVVPELLDQIERHGSNWEARVALADDAEKAWWERS